MHYIYLQRPFERFGQNSCSNLGGNGASIDIYPMILSVSHGTISKQTIGLLQMQVGEQTLGASTC